MGIVKLTKDNFDAEIRNFAGVSLIDFYADWCGPCQMVSPKVDEIADEQDKYKICKVNVDEEPELADAFGVSSIPTLVVLRGGEVRDEHIGLCTKARILEMLQNA